VLGMRLLMVASVVCCVVVGIICWMVFVILCVQQAIIQYQDNAEDVTHPAYNAHPPIPAPAAITAQP
jgi:hypothetical protein